MKKTFTRQALVDLGDRGAVLFATVGSAGATVSDEPIWLEGVTFAVGTTLTGEFSLNTYCVPTASLILLDNRLTEGPAAGTAWQDENQSARETNSQGGDGIRYVAL